MREPVVSDLLYQPEARIPTEYSATNMPLLADRRENTGLQEVREVFQLKRLNFGHYNGHCDGTGKQRARKTEPGSARVGLVLSVPSSDYE